MKKIFILMLTLFLSICLISCGEEKQDPPIDEKPDIVTPVDEEITIDNLSFEIPTVLNQSIKLIDEIEGIYINWSSNHPDVLTSEGYYFVPAENTEITLTAELDDGEKTKTLTYELVTDNKTSDPFNMAYTVFASKIKKQYNKNASLFEVTYRQFSGIFESMNQNVMDASGKIYQKDHDQELVIKLTITNNETSEVREYYIMSSVAEYSNNSYISLISEWVAEKVKKLSEGEIDKLPTEHELYPCTIEWTGGLKTFVSTNGEVVRPVDPVTDYINCKITYNDVTIAKSYLLEDFGGATESEFLDQWLHFIMPKEIVAHHNYVKWITNDYYFDHQVKVQEGGILNLIDGKPIEIDMTYYNDVVANQNNGVFQNKLWYTLNHRGVGTYVDQADLDSIFYPGYKIPNEENVIWIVVHESGMARPNEDAKCLAEGQRNNLYNKSGYRSASWQYQVDDGVIYQSFPDSMEAWHAGGNYSGGPHWPYGNTNGIGIEMCINADGNYDGALYMDTKLVATLVNRYHLSIENVARHYDFAGKECPAYMIRTSRWDEFRQRVNTELYALKYLGDAEVKWTVSDLDTLFTKKVNGLYYAKKVTEETIVTITLEVTKGDYHFQDTVTVTLMPDDIDLSVWAI